MIKGFRVLDSIPFYWGTRHRAQIARRQKQGKIIFEFMVNSCSTAQIAQNIPVFFSTLLFPLTSFSFILYLAVPTRKHCRSVSPPPHTHRPLRSRQVGPVVAEQSYASLQCRSHLHSQSRFQNGASIPVAVL